MPPLPVIPNVFRVTLKWQSGTLSARSVMNFEAAGSNPTAVFGALNANVTANMWGQTSSGSGVGEVDILPLDGSSGTSVFSTGFPARWLGTSGSTELLIAPAALVKLTTGLRGPAHRGRIFLPWPTEAVTTEGQLAGATQATMQVAWAAFLAAMVGAGINPVVASYRHAAAAIVTAYTVESLLATQRRRQSKLRRT